MADDCLVFRLKCAVQTYAWGKNGSSSEVARLSASADSNFVVKENVPYAELWMGTHPHGASMVSVPGCPEQSLESWLKTHPDSLGKEVLSYFNGSLPFLFKILSVNTSLSIQAHPHKVHAEVLHRKRPDLYQDTNHKPEIAVALTPFMALCGFRPIGEVAKFIKDIEEFRNVIGSQNAVKLMTSSRSIDVIKHLEAMKDAFTSMMQQSKKVVQIELRKLIQRIELTDASQPAWGEELDGHTVNSLAPEAFSHLADYLPAAAREGRNTKDFVGDVLLKLSTEFPDDVGCFSIYFLNVVTLQPGEAMFLDANIPHSYLSGDCMECMACSDNVVRAGLTPKFIDVHTLCEMLNYTGKPASRTKFRGIQSTENNCKITVFRPDINDFAVIQIQIGADVGSYKLITYDSASICIVIEGEGKAVNRTVREPIALRKGTVLFVSAREEVELCITSTGMHLFRALAGL